MERYSIKLLTQLKCLKDNMRKIILSIFYLFFSTLNLTALIEVDITRGNLDPLPIAVSPLHVDIKSQKYEGLKIKNLGENISKIVENNFRSTGLFNPLRKKLCSKNQTLHILNQDLKIGALIKAQALVTGNF